MGLEAATYPSQLVATNPTSGDPKSQGDDHIRLLKTVLQSTLPNITGAITATQAQLNTVGITQPQTDNSTNVASTAYAQAAASAAAALVNRDIPMSLVAVTGTTATAVGGQHLILKNVALTTVTLPASPIANDQLWITPANSLDTNVVARNGNLIMGLAEDMTLDSIYTTVRLKFIDSTIGWRLV